MDTRQIANQITDVAKSLTAKSIEDDIEEMAEMTDRNNHTEALLYLCENIITDERLAMILEHLKAIRDIRGSLTSELVEFRYEEIFKPAMKQVEKEFDEETAEKIKGTF